MRVLLIEDSDADALTVERRLRETPGARRWQLDRATALEPGLAQLGKGGYDAVVLDLGLPDSAGVETLTRLRAVDARVPVVVLTVSADDETALPVLGEGAQDYLVKDELRSGSALRRAILYAVERGRAEDAEARKLESLAVLAAGSAHAINNLLGRILLDLDALLQQVGRTGERSLLDRLYAIRNAAIEGESLGENLRTFAGIRPLRLRETSLSAFVLTLAELLESLVPKSVQLHFDVSGSSPRVRVDSNQLRQLLVALVLNAVEAIGRGRSGAIHVETGVLEADRELLRELRGGELRDPGYYGVLRVRDDGAGIRAERLSRIFDPFYTTRFAGRGLGLSAARGIAGQHGGGIHVASAPPDGTTVSVLLPLCD